jgi:arabinogalactan oligomer/maltooligosaccharide transport system substrate-binding protein
MKRLLTIGFLIFLASCSQSNVQSNILLVGEQEVTVMIGTNYVDLGVVAIEGDSFLEVVVQGQVDTNQLGVYIILYEATDSSGNKLSLTRKVTVVSELQGTEDVTTCNNPNGNQPCWNSERQAYLIEEGAVIVIGVDSMTMGRALEEQWRSEYPQYANVLRFENYNTQANQAGGTQGIIAGARTPDVALVAAAGVVGNERYFLQFEANLRQLVETNSNPSATALYNKNGFYISPSFWDGMAFVWNETMLRSFGIDVDTDSNNDGLPDAFNTWEKIFDLQIVGRTYKQQTINEIYPIVLDEPWSAYSNLTAGGFQMYADDDRNPGFGRREFLDGLRFIEDFSNQNFNLNSTGQKLTGAGLGWRWEGFLFNEAYPFSLVGTWMDINAAQNQNNAVYRISKMPTYRGNQLRPFGSNIGFVINGRTQFPSAAHEVVRWLNQESIIELMANNSDYISAISPNSPNLPTNISRLKQEFIVGLSENELMPNVPIEGTGVTDALEFYFNMNISRILQDLWNGIIPPEEAQRRIVQNSTN